MDLTEILKPERRAELENPQSDINHLIEVMDYGRETQSSIRINERNALTISAVWAAVNVIATGLAALPFRILRPIDDGRGYEEATTHPANYLLTTRPNRYMNAFTFKEAMCAHALTWGNGYARIVWDGAGRPAELLLLSPDNTLPVRKDGELYYISGANQEQFEPDEILHVPGPGFDGLKGYSVITMARESMGLTKAAELFGAKFFGNGATMSGVLEVPRAMNPKERQELGKKFDEMYGGLGSTTRTAVLTNGAKYNRIGLPPEDSQFLETRTFQVAEIARWFQVPPHKLAELSRATFSNIEAQNLDFLTGTLMPWLVRFEQEFTYKLLLRNSGLICDFDERSLRRGDLAARNAYYQTGRQQGFLSTNDIRFEEGLNPVEGGDDYWQPVNMVTLGEKPPTPDAPKTDEKPADQPADEPARSITLETLKPVLWDALRRMCRKESKIRDAHSGTKLEAKLRDHETDIVESITPALSLLGKESKAAQIASEIVASEKVADTEGQTGYDFDILKAVIQ